MHGKQSWKTSCNFHVAGHGCWELTYYCIFLCSIRKELLLQIQKHPKELVETFKYRIVSETLSTMKICDWGILSLLLVHRYTSLQGAWRPHGVHKASTWRQQVDLDVIEHQTCSSQCWVWIQVVINTHTDRTHTAPPCWRPLRVPDHEKRTKTTHTNVVTNELRL